MQKAFVKPTYMTSQTMKAIRKEELKLTQKEFAAFIGVSKSTIERLESGNQSITGPIALLLDMLKKNPKLIAAYTLPEKNFPLRLLYKYKDELCTVIDVDEITKQVEIYNYTNNLLFRAFGKEEHPSFEDYEEFLTSRCFPESRDKLKLVLRDLDLPFYDPILIIEKTEGRMAEDDFKLIIDR